MVGKDDLLSKGTYKGRGHKHALRFSIMYIH